MKAKVDFNLCIGCGLCADVCPEVFKMENDKAVAIVDIIPKSAEKCSQKASDSCPVAAITLN